MRFVGLICCYLSQCKFTESGEISFAKEVVERLRNFDDVVNLALAKSTPQRVYRDIDVHDFVSASKKMVRNGFAHTYAGGSRHYIIQGFEMLDVDSGDYRDPCMKKIKDIFIPFSILRT